MDHSADKLHKSSLSDLFSELTPTLKDDSVRDVLMQTILSKLLGSDYRKGDNNEDELMALIDRQYVDLQQKCSDQAEQEADLIELLGDETKLVPVPDPTPSPELIIATAMLALIRKQDYPHLAYQVYQQGQDIKALNDRVEFTEKIALQWKTSYEEALLLISMYERGANPNERTN